MHGFLVDSHIVSKYGMFDIIVDLMKQSQVVSVMRAQFYWKKMVKNVWLLRNVQSQSQNVLRAWSTRNVDLPALLLVATRTTNCDSVPSSVCKVILYAVQIKSHVLVTCLVVDRLCC